MATGHVGSRIAPKWIKFLFMEELNIRRGSEGVKGNSPVAVQGGLV